MQSRIEAVDWTDLCSDCSCDLLLRTERQEVKEERASCRFGLVVTRNLALRLTRSHAFESKSRPERTLATPESTQSSVSSDSLVGSPASSLPHLEPTPRSGRRHGRLRVGLVCLQGRIRLPGAYTQPHAFSPPLIAHRDPHHPLPAHPSRSHLGRATQATAQQNGVKCTLLVSLTKRSIQPAGGRNEQTPRSNPLLLHVKQACTAPLTRKRPPRQTVLTLSHAHTGLNRCGAVDSASSKRGPRSRPRATSTSKTPTRVRAGPLLLLRQVLSGGELCSWSLARASVRKRS